MLEKKYSPQFVFTVLGWASVILFTALYLSLAFSTSVWMDEAFTIHLLRVNLLEGIKKTAQDVHPPLYYIYAKFFYDVFNGSLFWQKIATIIPITLTFIYGMTVIRKEFGAVTSFLFVFFIGCIPCSMEFTIQLRMYTLAFFFVTICGTEAYRAFLYDRKRHFFFTALCGLGAAYTHYFAFVSAVFVYGFLLIAILVWKRTLIKTWLVTGFLMILGYAPWMPVLYHQMTAVESGYWIQEITGEAVWGYFVWAFSIEPFSGSVFIFIIMLKALETVTTCRLARKPCKEDIYALFCLLIPLCTCIAGVTISYLRTPIFFNRYIFPAIGLLALFFAIPLGKCKKKWIVLCSVFLMIVGAFQYKHVYALEYTSTPWTETKAFFDENLGENDYILHNFIDMEFVYDVHFPEDQVEDFETFDYTKEYDTLWYIDTETRPDITLEMLQEYGLEMSYIGQYGVEYNLFDVYKIVKKDKNH